MSYGRRKYNDSAWVAPEHSRDARAMDRDFPRDEYGRKILDSRGRQLLIDQRPSVMRPPRKTYPGTL